MIVYFKQIIKSTVKVTGRITILLSSRVVFEIIVENIIDLVKLWVLFLRITVK